MNIENLKEGDSVTVIAIQNADKFFKKWVKSTDTPNAASFNLSNGDWARERFGIQFVKPSEFIQVFEEENGTYMGDDNSNFQDFYKTEKLEILVMFEELSEGFHKQRKTVIL